MTTVASCFYENVSPYDTHELNGSSLSSESCMERNPVCDARECRLLGHCMDRVCMTSPPSPGGPALWAPPQQRSGMASTGLPLPDFQLGPLGRIRGTVGKGRGTWSLVSSWNFWIRRKVFLGLKSTLLHLWLKSFFFLNTELRQILDKSECT